MGRKNKNRNKNRKRKPASLSLSEFSKKYGIELFEEDNRVHRIEIEELFDENSDYGDDY